MHDEAWKDTVLRFSGSHARKRKRDDGSDQDDEEKDEEDGEDEGEDDDSQLLPSLPLPSVDPRREKAAAGGRARE